MTDHLVVNPWDTLAAQATRIHAEMRKAAIGEEVDRDSECIHWLNARILEALGEVLRKRLGIQQSVMGGGISKREPRASCTPFGLKAYFAWQPKGPEGLVLKAYLGDTLWTSSVLTGQDTLALALEDLKERVAREVEQLKVKERREHFKELKKALMDATTLEQASELSQRTLLEYPALSPTISELMMLVKARLLTATQQVQYAKDLVALQEALWTPFTAYRVSYNARPDNTLSGPRWVGNWLPESFPAFPTVVTAEATPEASDWWRVLSDVGDTHYGIPEDMKGPKAVRILSVATVETFTILHWEQSEASKFCTSVEYPAQDSRVFSLLLPPKGALPIDCGPSIWCHHQYDSRTREAQCLK